MIIRDQPLRMDSRLPPFQKGVGGIRILNLLISRRNHSPVLLNLACQRNHISRFQNLADKRLIEPNDFQALGLIADQCLRNIHLPARTALILDQLDRADHIRILPDLKLINSRCNRIIFIPEREIK